MSCDEIHKLANRWDKLADYIHEHDDDGLDRSEIKYVASEEKKLLPQTVKLITIAVDQKKKIAKLGKQLIQLLVELDGLDDDDDWSEDVALIDQVVGTIDKLTNECDKSSP